MIVIGIVVESCTGVNVEIETGVILSVGVSIVDGVENIVGIVVIVGVMDDVESTV